jgi:hypothetical protein
MKRVLVILAAAILVLTLATGTAFAAKHDKKTKPTTPEVLVTDWAGQITAALGDNEYTFVPVDTQYGISFILDCGPAWFAKVLLANGDAKVTGEIEKSKSGALEIGVQSVTDSTGATFKIKGEGKPPWAGGNGHKPATAGVPDDD